VARSNLRATRRELLVRTAIAAGAVALPGAAASAQSRRVKPEHVVFVDWDGFGSGLLDRVSMPNLQSLIARGSLSAAKSTYNTYSNSARASMSTGAYPEVHGNAGYYLDRERDVVVSQNRDLRAQTINQALAETGRTTASVGWYMVENFGTTYQATAARLPGLIADLKLVTVEGGPHNIGWTHPQQVNQALLEFVGA
jgi:predicted AlkP superfamily pyrophosphatase or phosphodiesterase